MLYSCKVRSAYNCTNIKYSIIYIKKWFQVIKKFFLFKSSYLFDLPLLNINTDIKNQAFITGFVGLQHKEVLYV